MKHFSVSCEGEAGWPLPLVYFTNIEGALSQYKIRAPRASWESQPGEIERKHRFRGAGIWYCESRSCLAVRTLLLEGV